jgi:hypothetical protein
VQTNKGRHLFISMLLREDVGGRGGGGCREQKCTEELFSTYG